MKKIWVVYGRTGEYSDRKEWTVRSFITQAKAEEFVRLLEQATLELLEKYESIADWRWPEDGSDREQHPIDPDFDCDYKGTKYFVTETDLDDEV